MQTRAPSLQPCEYRTSIASCVDTYHLPALCHLRWHQADLHHSTSRPRSHGLISGSRIFAASCGCSRFQNTDICTAQIHSSPQAQHEDDETPSLNNHGPHTQLQRHHASPRATVLGRGTGLARIVALWCVPAMTERQTSHRSWPVLIPSAEAVQPRRPLSCISFPI